MRSARVLYSGAANISTAWACIGRRRCFTGVPLTADCDRVVDKLAKITPRTRRAANIRDIANAKNYYVSDRVSFLVVPRTMHVVSQRISTHELAKGYFSITDLDPLVQHDLLPTANECAIMDRYIEVPVRADCRAEAYSKLGYYILEDEVCTLDGDFEPRLVHFMRVRPVNGTQAGHGLTYFD